jgi:hypothetical protein
MVRLLSAPFFAQSAGEHSDLLDKGKQGGRYG